MPNSARALGVQKVWVWLLAAFILLAPLSVRAHLIDNATLLLEEKGQGEFFVRFQAGSPALGAIEAPVRYPAGCLLDGARLSCGPAGLSGELEFPWLAGTLTRLIVDIQWRDGSRLQRVVSPDDGRLTVYDRGATGFAADSLVLLDYGWLGVEHILFGFDHLCFVIALGVLVRGTRRLVATITAFTVAHSVTLACSVLGYWAVSIVPVEALIALSIVLVCAECLRPDESITRRAPWIVAFSFGLLHGFGFASALAEVGLPEARLPLALLGFNLGVELGQLLVVLVFLGLGAILSRFERLRDWAPRALIYAMGSVAAFWSIERVLAVFGLAG